jgi:hypothetical protein
VGSTLGPKDEDGLLDGISLGTLDVDGRTEAIWLDTADKDGIADGSSKVSPKVSRLVSILQGRHS